MLGAARPFRLRLVSGLLTAALPVLVACDPASFSTSPSPECAEAGAQCQLPEGPIGVCERAPCPLDEMPPCFTCTPQH